MKSRLFVTPLALLCVGLPFTSPAKPPDVIFQSGFEPAPEVVYTLKLTPNAVLFTAPGESRDLSAAVFDADGTPASPELSWRSSQPGVVSVSPQGEIMALAASGSAQIIVETEGAMPAMALVVIAAPAAGAMLVSDDQLLAGPTMVDPNAPQVVSGPALADASAPYGLGTQYTVELALASAPAVGQVLLASGEAPIGGRVVSFMAISGGFLVTLEVIPIAEMFDQLELNETLDLSTAPATIDPALTDVYDVVRRVDGSVQLHLKPAVTKSSTSALFDFDDCEPGSSFPNFQSLLMVDLGPDVGIEHGLDFHIGYGSDGLEELRVEGFVQGVFEVKPRVASAFEGKVKCTLDIYTIAIPFGGPLSWIIAGRVPLGIGFEIGGKMILTEPMGFDVTVSAGASFNTGLVCAATGCEMVADFDGNVDGALRPVVPPSLSAALGTTRFEAVGQGFAYAQMGIGNPFLSSLGFEPIEVSFGLRQSLDLETPASQAGKADYASGFKLELAASAGASHQFNDLLSLLQISASPLTLEIAQVLAQSPHATLAISPSEVLAGSGGTPGEPATFTVTFPSVGYGLIDDVVGAVELYFAEDDGTGGVTLSPAPGDCDFMPSSPGQTVFGCQAGFGEEHVGQQQFVAFYSATLFGLPLPIPLEITDNSTVPLSVTSDSVSSVVLEVDFDERIAVGEETPIQVRAGVVTDSGIQYLEGVEIGLYVHDGNAEETVGTTDAGGFFQTTVTLDEDENEVEVEIEARFPGGELLEQTVTSLRENEVVLLERDVEIQAYTSVSYSQTYESPLTIVLDDVQYTAEEEYYETFDEERSSDHQGTVLGRSFDVSASTDYRTTLSGTPQAFAGATFEAVTSGEAFLSGAPNAFFYQAYSYGEATLDLEFIIWGESRPFTLNATLGADEYRLSFYGPAHNIVCREDPLNPDANVACSTFVESGFLPPGEYRLRVTLRGIAFLQPDATPFGSLSYDNTLQLALEVEAP